MTEFIYTARNALLPRLFGIGLALACGNSSAAETDSTTGLILAPGWEEVRNNCTACHSAKFITWQRGDRDTWLSMIRWMQKTQGLWQLPPATEETILDYLAKNYPPGAPSRRPNLPPSALP